MFIGTAVKSVRICKLLSTGVSKTIRKYRATVKIQ